jgi:DNA-binding NtrC family response regulator
MKPNSVIVFSKSPQERDFLRSRISELGLNTVCFENEAICFDNIKPITPKIVIIQTDSKQVAWRFVFAICASGVTCPLLVVSARLKICEFSANGVGLPIYRVANHLHGDRLALSIMDIINNTSGIGKKEHLSLFLGQSKKISQIRSMLPSIAASRDSVMVIGERGTGKELLVRLLSRSASPGNLFVKIDCGELAPSMLTNEWYKLIATIKSDSRTVTLLLDRIHLVSKQIQAEILLTMEESDSWMGLFENCEPGKVRFVATSELAVDALVSKGQFRKDLFYRLNVIPILIPPLRERKEDISLLMDYFIINSAASSDKYVTIPSQRARETLYLYDWPGNVQELETYMQRVAASGNESCILANNHMPKVKRNAREYFLKSASIEHLPDPHQIKSLLPDAEELPLRRICEEFVARTEKKLMQKALESTNWNRKQAAKLLDISYKSMLNKMKAYDII